MPKMSRATVVVLGDIGRSPRMCYHAFSMAQKGIVVDLVGYLTTRPHRKIIDNANIRLVGLPSPPSFLSLLPFAIFYLSKFVWTSFFLLLTLLFRIGFPSLVLVQNPPGLPSLAVCHFVARLKQTKFAVDWHNYSWTVLKHQWQIDMSDGVYVASVKGRRRTEGKRPGTKFRLVQMAQWLEAYYGRKANWNLCVSHAMRDDLLSNWSVKAVTLYDRPPSWQFGGIVDLDARHQLMIRLSEQQDQQFASFGNECGNRFTVKHDNGTVSFRADRPALLISSTSWTLDEDFAILLDALVKYDAISCENADRKLPNLLAVITGKGPEKYYYLERINKLHLHKVEIVTGWLQAEDYGKLLSCADLGLSLHTSTSGLDLPMKVVDMFGCGLPVLAMKFPCIEELVKVPQNGLLFEQAGDLAQKLTSLFDGFPDDSHTLAQMKNNLLEAPLVSWEDNWDATVFPLIHV